MFVESFGRANSGSVVQRSQKSRTVTAATRTLPNPVHNPHYHADGNTVRSIASNLEPFLQALNDDLG